MDILTTVIIALLFFIMGAAIVGLIWYSKGVSRKESADPISATSEDPNLFEIARLMRNTQNQELVVMMNDQNFDSFSQLSPVQQRRLAFTSNVLSKWIAQADAEPLPQAEPAADPAGEPAEQPANQPAPAAIQDPFEIPESASSSSGAEKAGYIPPFAPDTTIEEVKPISADLPNLVGGLVNPAPKSVPAFKSIAMQINEILQAKLVGTELESRGVALMDAPDHGVLVTLDGKQYNSVTEVPDEQVRQAIRAAVLDWETKK